MSLSRPLNHVRVYLSLASHLAVLATLVIYSLETKFIRRRVNLCNQLNHLLSPSLSSLSNGKGDFVPVCLLCTYLIDCSSKCKTQSLLVKRERITGKCKKFTFNVHVWVDRQFPAYPSSPSLYPPLSLSLCPLFFFLCDSSSCVTSGYLTPLH